MYHYHNQGAAPHPSFPSSSKPYLESFYQEQNGKKLGGKTEVNMPDGTRCDILTDTHAIEVNYADEWEEAIESSRNFYVERTLTLRFHLK